VLAAMTKPMTTGVVLLIVYTALKAIQAHFTVTPGTALKDGV
jgi:hypothetical protein